MVDLIMDYYRIILVPKIFSKRQRSKALFIIWAAFKFVVKSMFCFPRAHLMHKP